jgi:hypothetical protein
MEIRYFVRHENLSDILLTYYCGPGNLFPKIWSTKQFFKFVNKFTHAKKGDDWCRMGNRTELRLGLRFACKSGRESNAKTYVRHPLGTWVLGYLGTWVCGYLGTWVIIANLPESASPPACMTIAEATMTTLQTVNPMFHFIFSLFHAPTHFCISFYIIFVQRTWFDFDSMLLWLLRFRLSFFRHCCVCWHRWFCS